MRAGLGLPTLLGSSDSQSLLRSETTDLGASRPSLPGSYTCSQVVSPPGSPSIQLGCAPHGASRPPPASALLPPGLGLSCPRDLVLFLLARLCLATESVQHTSSRSPPRFPSDSESLSTRSTRTRPPRFSQGGRREALAEQSREGPDGALLSLLCWPGACPLLPGWRTLWPAFTQPTG